MSYDSEHEYSLPLHESRNPYARIQNSFPSCGVLNIALGPVRISVFRRISRLPSNYMREQRIHARSRSMHQGVFNPALRLHLLLALSAGQVHVFTQTLESVDVEAPWTHINEWGSVRWSTS